MDLNHQPRPYQGSAFWFYNDLQGRGDCQSTAKSHKTTQIVGWVVGWKIESTPTGNEQPAFDVGCQRLGSLSGWISRGLEVGNIPALIFLVYLNVVAFVGLANVKVEAHRNELVQDVRGIHFSRNRNCAFVVEKCDFRVGIDV